MPALPNVEHEDAFFFPPFHPNCRCTVVAVGIDGKDLPEGMENYATESSTSFYDVDENFQIIPRRNISRIDQITSREDAETYFEHHHHINFDFGSTDVSDWQEFVQPYDKALSDVYDLVGSEFFNNLSKISIEEAEESLRYAIGWAGETGKKISLNQKYLEFDNLFSVMSKNVKNGSYSKLVQNGFEQYPLAHELGHAAYASLSTEQKEKISELFYSELNVKNPISKVAAQNPNEFFAEYIGIFSIPNNRNSWFVPQDSPYRQILDQIQAILKL